MVQGQINVTSLTSARLHSYTEMSVSLPNVADDGNDYPTVVHGRISQTRT